MNTTYTLAHTQTQYYIITYALKTDIDDTYTYMHTLDIHMTYIRHTLMQTTYTTYRYMHSLSTCLLCFYLVLAQEVVSEGVPIALGAATAQQSPL